MLGSWIGSSVAAADTEHLRKRVGLYARVMFVVDLLGYSSDFLMPQLVENLAVPDYGPQALAIRVASTAIVVLAVLVSRFSRPPAVVLVGLEVAVTVGLSLVYVHVALDQIAGDIAGFAPVFAMFGLILLLGVRAALVPSPVGRTVIVGLVAMALLFVLQRERITAQEAAVQEGVRFIAVAYVLATAVTSHVIYGLRREIRAAMQLGQYTLEERLGQGGMGSVYRARHSMLRRRAAIKVIRPDAGVASGELRARFEREADATASLESPHTVGLYDFGVSTDGEFYTVMELLRGVDLDTAIRRFGPMPPERVAFLARQACASLAEAHGAGLIHRDVKPANLMICRYGGRDDFLKVLDFGLVAIAAAPTAERAAGTPGYLAPEVATGGAVDARADLYALGCVMYWALTGLPVFPREDTRAMIRAHVEDEPHPPSAVVETAIPPALDSLVLACLAKDPSSRPASADELSRQLDLAVDVGAWTPDRAAAWWDRHRPEEARAPDASLEGQRSLTARLR